MDEEEGISNDRGSATETIKSGLSKIITSKVHVESLEQKLHEELFDKGEEFYVFKKATEIRAELLDKWEENYEVLKKTEIKAESMTAFLDDMRESYKGISDDIRSKIGDIKFTDGTWELKILEYKFKPGADKDSYPDKETNSKVIYGLIAFGKTPDRLQYDCMYVSVSMDFKISNRKENTMTHPSVLSDLMAWSSETNLMETTIGATPLNEFQRFFQYKALQCFLKEGMIDEITSEDSSLLNLGGNSDSDQESTAEDSEGVLNRQFQGSFSYESYNSGE